MAQHKVKELELENKLNASQQQVVQQMAKEEKHVNQLNQYIKEEQRSKVVLSKEFKMKIEKLEDNLAAQKSAFTNNITAYKKKQSELETQLGQSLQLIELKKS